MIVAAHLLALTMWGECRAGGDACMRAVGHVVVNRVRSGQDVDVPHAVWRRGQFACWRDGNRQAMRAVASLAPELLDARAWKRAQLLAQRILAHRDADPTGGATHYHAAGVRPAWARTMHYRVTFAGQRFYRERAA
jgi:spore germination cell wall hydrolase CwlJ-like protein